MARKRVNTIKYEIIQVATEFFLEKGVSATSPRMIAEELGISTGNITYYFPTKDHILAVLAEMLCDFQWHLMKKEANDGMSSVMAVCLELAAMAAMCEENEIAKDLYLSFYTNDHCLAVIQQNDTKRAKQVYAEFHPDWTDEQYAQKELIASGIEYATLRAGESAPPLEARISGALEAILTAFGVPEDTRRLKIAKVLALDYRSISRRIFSEFKDYVQQTTESTLEEIMPKLRRRA